jgi:phage FluMu protein Com
MICRNCRKNLGQTHEQDRVGDTVFEKKCPICGFVNRRIYPGYSEIKKGKES